MPPKGRPRRNAARKPNSTPQSQSQTQTDVVSSQTLTSPEKPLDDVVSSETLDSSPVQEPTLVAINGGEASDIAKPVTDDDDKSIVKPKKVVKKKTIKVLKKVIKKVPKKVVKQGIDPKCGEISEDFGNAELESKVKSTAVDEGQLKEESDGLAAGVEIDEKMNKVEDAKVEVEAEVNEKNNNILEENKVEVDERSEKLDEVEGKKSVEIKGSECIEVDNTVRGNVEDFRMEGECEKKEDGITECGKEEEGGRECGKEGEELAEGGNKEEIEGEEEVGERQLFKGELGAMERKKRRKREVFIGRLDKDVQEEDVRKVFQEVGEIAELRVLMNSKTGKKFAFVMYNSAEDAQKALQKFAKVEICGKKYGATPVEGNDTIFLGNVDKKWMEEDVVQLLKKIGIGKIDKVTVMVDPNNTKCNRGFAFVEFETITDAQVAYAKLQEKDVFGKNQKLKVAWAEPLRELDEEEMLKVKTVYAEFIPSSWDEEKVRDTFTKFGEIDDIVLARNLRTSKRKDFAFISYKTRVAAIKCIESFDLNLEDGVGTKLNVKVSLAKPKSKSKKLPLAKPFASEIPKARPATSHCNVRPVELRNRTQLSVPHYGIQIPKKSSTNVELVHLLREQASWRPTHASLSNGPMDNHYPNPLSGRKRQLSVLETDRLHEDLNGYPRSRLEASYSVASSSHSLLPPSAHMNPMAYHQQHGDYSSAGSVYGARNYASNVEIRGRAHERCFPYRRYPG